MHIMFYKQGEVKPYKTPNDVGLDDGETIDFNETAIVNVDPPEPNSDFITAYTEGGYFYITYDKQDLLDLMSAMYKTYKDRTKFYEALDSMLDSVDANGFSQDDVFIKVKAIDVETMSTGTVVENIMEFVTEFASGEVEERTVESWTYRDGKQGTGWKQTIE